MLKSEPGVQRQGGHFDTEFGQDKFMLHGPSTPPDGIVAISPIDRPTNVLILEKWVGDKPPTAEEFAKAATVIDVAADHTLLMSNHMPHAGGDMPGLRAHALISKPDHLSKTTATKQQFWLKPEAVAQTVAARGPSVSSCAS